MSQSANETELVFHAKLASFEELLNAEKIELHVQFENTFITGGRARVRMTRPIKGGPTEAGDNFVFTIKNKVKLEDGVTDSVVETNTPVDRNFYENFAPGAVRGMVKKRYSFTGQIPKFEGHEGLALPPLVYEVDVFTNAEGKQVEWVKIDVELDTLIDVLKGHNLTLADIRQKFTFDSLGLNMSGVFLAQDQTPEQGRLLDYLWKEQYTIEVMDPTYIEIPKAQGVLGAFSDAVKQVMQTSDQQNQQQQIPEEEPGQEDPSQGEGNDAPT